MFQPCDVSVLPCVEPAQRHKAVPLPSESRIPKSNTLPTMHFGMVECYIPFWGTLTLISDLGFLQFSLSTRVLRIIVPTHMVSIL